MSKRVVIDISLMHGFSKKRGIGSYAKNLYKSLKEYTDLDIVLNEERGFSGNSEIIHYPFFDFFQPTLPVFKKAKTVVTIHDVIPLKFSEHYPSGVWGGMNLIRQKIALKNVDAVITDSMASKGDIRQLLNIQDEKIHPIYLAPSDSFKVIKDSSLLKSAKEKYKLPEKFVLYVGNVNWNKNIVNMALGCMEADVKLVIMGSGFNIKNNETNHPELKSYREFMSKFKNNENIQILGYVEDDEIVQIYNLATLLILPSFYEGFGLPVLEAQACGVPVVTSKNSSLEEVGADSVVYIDPYSAESISKGILAVFGDETMRRQLIGKGFGNIKRFSWEQTARETRQVYESL